MTDSSSVQEALEKLLAAADEASDRGDHEGAANCIRKALRLCGARPENAEIRAFLLRGLGNIFLDMARPGEAIEALNDALFLMKNQENKDFPLLLKVDIGRCYETFNDYKNAEALWEESYNEMECLPHCRPAIAAVVLLNATVVKMRQKQWSEALQRAEKALVFAEQVKDDQLHLIELIKGNIALINQETGRGEGKTMSDSHAVIKTGIKIIDLLNMFLGLVQQNREQDALELLENNKDIALRAQRLDLQIRFWINLAMARQLRHRSSSEVAAAAAKAIEVLERLQKSETQFGIRTGMLREIGNWAYRYVAAAEIDLKNYANAFKMIDAAKAPKYGTDQCCGTIESFRQKVPKSVFDNWRKLRQEVHQEMGRLVYCESHHRKKSVILTNHDNLSESNDLLPGRELPKSNASSCRIEVTPDILFKKQEAHANLLRHIGEEYPGIKLNSPFSISSLSDVQRSLKPDEAILQCLYLYNRLIMLVITQHNIQSISTPLGISLISRRIEIEELSFSCREMLRDPTSSLEELDDVLARLGELILGKVIIHLRKVKTLIWVPFGALTGIPLAALRINGKYLSEQWTIVHIPLASMVSWLRNRDYEGSLLALANPDSTLYGAEDEVEYLKQKYGALTEKHAGASIDFLRQHASKAGLIHLSCHGLFNEQFPGFSALMLAPATPDGQGLLFACDVPSLSLDASMVVLSACQTGLAQESAYEDISGIAVSFLCWGSDSVLASLWSVDDIATKWLMMGLYDNLNAGYPKAEALQKASLSVMQENRFRHPNYWASFALIGDWRGRIRIHASA